MYPVLKPGRPPDVSARHEHMKNNNEFTYPMRCLRCQRIHDASKVTPSGRYSDCTTWRCPNCNSLIDDRPASWGGSAVAVSALEAEVDAQGMRFRY